MAVEKLAGPPKVLAFYFVLADLLNAESLWTLYKAMHKQGEETLDALSLTEAEEDIFTELAKDATFTVMNPFIKYSTGITNALQFNVDYTPSGGVAAKSIVIKIVDHEAYNAGYPPLVSQLFERALKFYILKEWLLIKGVAEESAVATGMFNITVAELTRSSMPLKKPALGAF